MADTPVAVTWHQGVNTRMRCHRIPTSRNSRHPPP